MAEQPSEGAAATGNVFRALVTIGVPLGVIVDPETREQLGLMRHGRELLRFDTDAYQVLVRATSTVSREHLIEWAAEGGVHGPDAVIGRCLEDGLLRDLAFDPRQPDQWSRLRLQALGLGMGPDSDGRWNIDLPRRETAQVDRITYLLWAASDGRSIGAVAEMLVKENVASKSDIALILPLCIVRILTQGAAFLDLAP